MRTLIYVIPTLLWIVLVAACGDGSTPDAASTEQAAAEQTAQADAAGTVATMEDGVQVVHVTVGPMGYRPARMELRQGIPARLVFTRSTGSSCSEQVQSPELGIALTDLPVGEPVAIEFTPDKSGQYILTCGMRMIEGTIIVKS